jgi:hypothetical protein
MKLEQDDIDAIAKAVAKTFQREIYKFFIPLVIFIVVFRLLGWW